MSAHVALSDRTQFDRLITIGPPIRKGSIIFYEVECVCGVRKMVRYTDLNSGNTRSCGCLRAEMVDGGIKLKQQEKGVSGPATRPYLVPVPPKPKEKPGCICSQTRIIDGTRWTVIDDHCPVCSIFYRVNPYARKAQSIYAGL
jgi:hypothetical protein